MIATKKVEELIIVNRFIQNHFGVHMKIVSDNGPRKLRANTRNYSRNIFRSTKNKEIQQKSLKCALGNM